MKRQLILSIAFSVFAASTFAQAAPQSVAYASAPKHTLVAYAKAPQHTLVAEGGSDRTLQNHVA